MNIHDITGNTAFVCSVLKYNLLRRSIKTIYVTVGKIHELQPYLLKFLKNDKKLLKKMFCYIIAGSVYIYQFCDKVHTVIQLWPNLFANKAIYVVTDAWRLFIISSKGNEWQTLSLVKEG